MELWGWEEVLNPELESSLHRSHQGQGQVPCRQGTEWAWVKETVEPLSKDTQEPKVVTCRDLTTKPWGSTTLFYRWGN